MGVLRAGWVAWRLAWPHVLAPWRSPLVRWRLETYGITDAQGRLLHAEEISAADFWRFTWRHRKHLRSFLYWAATLDRQ